MSATVIVSSALNSEIKQEILNSIYSSIFDIIFWGYYSRNSTVFCLLGPQQHMKFLVVALSLEPFEDLTNEEADQLMFTKYKLE